MRQSTDSSTIPRCIDLMCHLTDKGTCQESVLRDLSEISRGGGGVGILNLGSEIR